jgi:predicted enzyme involved in methoxymalonyl-ACP biosynthesis
VLRCTDKYGSYGTVGLGLVRRRGREIRVEEFMLSCRVQGRLIEQAFFRHLLEGSNTKERLKLWVNFHPTHRNRPAAQVLDRLNFRADAPGDGLVLDVSRHSLSRAPIEIVSEQRIADPTGLNDQVRR